MFLDDLLKLADAQESTISAASTNTINASSTLGDSYQGLWFYTRIDTAFAVGAGGPEAKFSLQTSETPTWDEYTTLVSTETMLAAALTAGTEIKLSVPPGIKRYLRGYFTGQGSLGAAISDTQKFSAGKWDMFLVKDVDIQNF